MSARYREISYADFKAMMDDMDFVQIDLSGTMEFVFQRDVVCTRSHDGRFKIRIMSSVDKRSLVTREVGGDAIRVLLLDTQGRKEIVQDWTVYRTANALENTRERAREAYGYVSKHPEHHCSCGFLMVKRDGRKGPFLGCTAYPDCKETKPV